MLARNNLYFDVTTLLNVPLRDGIRRVSRLWLDGLVAMNPDESGYLIHPIRFENETPVYTFELLKIPTPNGFGFPLHGIKTEIKHGSKLFIPAYDIFVPERNIDFSQVLHGVEVTSVIYDLLPINHPDWFPESETKTLKFQKSIYKQLFYSDKIIVNSSQVKDDVLNFAELCKLPFSERSIRVIPLPSFNLNDGVKEDIKSFDATDAKSNFLVVGTIEPRKGHLDILTAFEEARKLNPNISLTIVGRIGWGADEVLKSLKECQRRYPKHFEWLSNVSDSELAEAYARADAVIVASLAEGFGLPVVESLAKGKATFIRGIPVLEEVSKGHAITFGFEKDYESLASIFMDSSEAIAKAAIKAKGFEPNLLAANMDNIVDFLNQRVIAKF